MRTRIPPYQIFNIPALTMAVLFWCGFVVGQDKNVADLPNLKMPTLGGKQFWTDHRWLGGWRIQQNAITGHWRLLDKNNVRHAWGARETCESVLRESVAGDSSITSAQVIVLLHGLFRTSKSMASMAEFLRQQGLGEPVMLEYASTRDSITHHAQAFREVIEGLPGKPLIHLVAHSMGNIVIRHAISDWMRDDPHQVMPRIQRFVMLGPPNQGASIARHLGELKLFEIIAGKGGMELGPAWGQLQPKLATPPFPFAIVAGKLENPPVNNPLVEGAGDFVVGLDEAKLAGAAEIFEVPVVHSFLMNDRRVQTATARFLRGQPMGDP